MVWWMIPPCNSSSALIHLSPTVSTAGLIHRSYTLLKSTSPTKAGDVLTPKGISTKHICLRLSECSLLLGEAMSIILSTNHTKQSDCQRVVSLVGFVPVTAPWSNMRQPLKESDLLQRQGKACNGKLTLRPSQQFCRRPLSAQVRRPRPRSATGALRRLRFPAFQRPPAQLGDRPGASR